MAKRETVDNQSLRTKVLYGVLGFEISKGHLKWKVSDVARSIGVSRALIYYHFGKTKGAIVDACLAVLAEDYYGLTAEREQFLREHGLTKSLVRTRRIFLENPSIAVFYQKWRMQPSPIGDQLIKIEERYQKRMSALFPHLSAVEIKALHGLFHGLITAPFLTDAAFEKAVAMIDLKLPAGLKR